MILIIFIILILIIILNYKIKDKFSNFKKKPKPHNCNIKSFSNQEIYNNIDSNIKYSVENDVVTPKYYSALIEISNTKFQKLLNSINNKHKIKCKNMKFKEITNTKYDYWKGLVISNIEYNKPYNIILKILLIKINNNINNVDYFKFNNKFDIFKNMLIYVGKYCNYHKYVFQIIIYRKYKLTGFTIQAEAYYNIKNNSVYFDNIKILGNIDSYKIASIVNKIDNYSPKYNNNIDIWWRYPYKSLNETDAKFGENIIRSDAKIQKIKKSKINYNNLFNNLCYDENRNIQYNSSNKIICENNRNFFNKSKKIGIWDKECTNNYECPFYKSNRNYKNTFGGCNNGVCELPINMKNFGFKFYNKKKIYKPFCYNCPDNKIGPCCDLQKNKNKYPLLNTPDYAFKDDNIYRYNQRNTLKLKNLKWGNLK